MMYNYPFFSFPHFRRYTSYYPMQYPYKNDDYVNNNQVIKTINKQNNYQNRYSKSSSLNKPINYYQKANSSKENSYSRDNKYYTAREQYNKNNSYEPKGYKKEGSSPKRTPSGFSFLNNFLHQEDRGDDEEFFEFLGLKLYHDDLLLLGLIFFLYKEDVKDQYLFFALILLLLS